MNSKVAGNGCQGKPFLADEQWKEAANIEYCTDLQEIIPALLDMAAINCSLWRAAQADVMLWPGIHDVPVGLTGRDGFYGYAC